MLPWIIERLDRKLDDVIIHGASGPLTQNFALLQIWSKFGPQILPNYVASSSPRSVISVTQPFFLKNEKCGKDFVAGFAQKLVSTHFDQTQVKQIILKDSGG